MTVRAGGAPLLLLEDVTTRQVTYLVHPGVAPSAELDIAGVPDLETGEPVTVRPRSITLAWVYRDGKRYGHPDAEVSVRIRGRNTKARGLYESTLVYADDFGALPLTGLPGWAADLLKEHLP